MQIIFMPILGRLSDRFGRRPVLIVSLAGTALGFLIMGWATSLPLLFAARIIDGATGGNISTAQAYIADISTPENRSRSMGMIGAAFGLGFTFGPMIGGIMSRISYGAPFYFAAPSRAVNVVLLYFILPESLSPEYRSQPHERTRLAEVFQHGHGRMFGTIVATYFFTITGFAIMTTLFALFTEKHFGFDARKTGYLFGFIGIISVILQGGLIGRLIKIFGETTLARTGLLLLAAALALLPLVPHTANVARCLRGARDCQRSREPDAQRTRLANDRSQLAGTRARAYASAGSVGRLVGPLLGGWLLMFDLDQPLTHYARTPFFAGAAILLVAFALAFSVRKPIADEGSDAALLLKQMS